MKKLWTDVRMAELPYQNGSTFPHPIATASFLEVRTSSLARSDNAGSAWLFGFSLELNPFSVAELDSSFVKVSPYTTLTSKPVNPKDESLKTWSD